MIYTPKYGTAVSPIVDRSQRIIHIH